RAKLHAEFAIKNGECSIRLGGSPAADPVQAVQKSEAIDSSNPPKKGIARAAAPEVEPLQRTVDRPARRNSTETGTAQRPVGQHAPVVSAPKPDAPEVEVRRESTSKVPREPQADSKTTAIQPSETLDGSNAEKSGDSADNKGAEATSRPANP